MLRLFTVTHQMPTNVEQQSAPCQQHKHDPSPWACPRPHVSLSLSSQHSTHLHSCYPLLHHQYICSHQQKWKTDDHRNSKGPEVDVLDYPKVERTVNFSTVLVLIFSTCLAFVGSTDQDPCIKSCSNKTACQRHGYKIWTNAWIYRKKQNHKSHLTLLPFLKNAVLTFPVTPVLQAKKIPG